VRTLAPDAVEEVFCHASFPSPGVFELSKIRVKITNPPDLAHMAPNIQYIITVLGQT